MSDALEGVQRRLLRATATLQAAGIGYAVVGGNAVAAWVSTVDEAAVRNTRAVDLLLRRADLPSATVALEAAGWHHRRVASLGQAGAIPNAKVTESENTGTFRLISLEALVRMKLCTFRDKDRVHLRDLAAVGLIDETWPQRFSEELNTRLSQVLASPEG